tara:strand:- start:317 stop:1498 length:1182 start_codon:yes stop_codon:yes gene_type:complete
MKKIGVFTGNRAEFGLQVPMLQEIKASKKLDLELLVSASHLDKDYGETKKEILESGFKINYSLDLKQVGTNVAVTPDTIGKGAIGVSKILKKMKPDIFVVYADRYEGFAAVVASTQMGIPTIHIEGGDITEGGAFDDSVRHAMTKLAHIHFTTNKEATTRIKSMGEESWRVHTVGLPSVDLIKKGKFTNKEELLDRYKLTGIDNLIIFTQHSVPIKNNLIQREFKEIEKAFSKLKNKNYKIICTYPNSDFGGKKIIPILKMWNKKYDFIDLYPSLGREDFHGLLNLNNNSNINVAYVGNSSAGIKETPALKCPSLILGDRQKGRLHSTNAIFVNLESEKISKGIEKVLSKRFISVCKKCSNPYGSGNMGKKSTKIIENLKIDHKLIIKKFIDL